MLEYKQMENNYNPEDEVSTDGQWKLVDLPEVDIKTGEENLEEMFTARTKLYRWRKTEWKERGIGNFRILKNKADNRISGVLRQEQTMKIMANFFILSIGELCVLTRLKTNDKSWMWTCLDFSDGGQELEQFCLKFKTKDEFEKFNIVFAEAKAANDTLEWGVKKPKETESKSDEVT